MVSIYIFINRVIDVLMRPFEGISPVWPLAAWSVIMGVAAMIIYKYTSSQDGIRDAKDKIKGHFYEVWLFIDDAPVIARAQARIFFNAFRYLFYALPPLIIMIVLFFPLFANFEVRYAMRPVKVGDKIMVTLRLSGRPAEGWQDKVSLQLPDGVSMIGQPVRFIRKVMESPDSYQEKSRDYEVDYMLSPQSPGRHDLDFTVDGKSVTVPFIAGDDYGRRLAPYATTGLLDALLFPPLTSVPGDAGIESVMIAYPEADFPFLGWNTWWVWPFLIISVVAAFAVKGVFKVEI